MPSRREFLRRSVAAAGLAPSLTGSHPTARAASRTRASHAFLDVQRPPDSVVVDTQALGGPRSLRAGPGGRWENGAIVVTLTPEGDAVRVQLASPSTAIRRVWLRWRERLDSARFVLGDAWERGYGDFEWRGFVPDRVMPWYVATTDGQITHAYGVRTSASAFCYWQIDPEGLSLAADVRSGGSAVELGSRVLTVCDVLSREGRAGESAFAALRDLCRRMCPSARMPAQPLYGSNDWYWAYGRNSAATVLADADHIVDLSPDGANRPYAVIDDGWQPERGQAKTGVGTWDRGNEKFPDMPGLAADIVRKGVRPGIWIRPLLSPATAPDSWRLPRDRNVLDPSVPEVLDKVAADVARVRQWGYQLIKHDYSTFDIFGRWGSTMADALTRDGWTFAEGPRRTTAEVISGLYRAIRQAAVDALVIGCNTVSHLSAGVFDVCRTGDDTSGRDWARTRKMGVNTLAFRGVQHGTFYVADADCVGVTTSVPWALNRQWLDLLSRSGTMLFVSLAPDALGEDVRRDLRTALSRAARPQPLGEPLDWQQSTCPARWTLMGETVEFNWF